jgi:hypothetical protein
VPWFNAPPGTSSGSAFLSAHAGDAREALDAARATRTATV